MCAKVYIESDENNKIGDIMKTIEIKDFLTINQNIDFEKAKQKEICDNKINDKYLKIYIIYKYGLELYLNKLLDIKKYDLLLQNSNLYFDETKEKDFYQYYNTLDTKYFYLRNDLHIERLEQNDIEKILSLDLNNNISDLITLISKTYQKIIKKYENYDDDIYVTYSINDSSLDVMNSGIVFGLHYDAYSDIHNLNDKWEENHLKQMSLIYDTIDKMEKEMTDKLKRQVKVLIYNTPGIIPIKKD